MNSEANFDILYILNSLENTYDSINIVEIQNICYLSLLVSVFDKNPISDWGYEFIYDNDEPFSYAIINEIEDMMKSGTIIKEDKENYKLGKEAKRIFGFINNLEEFSKRKKYLQVSADAALVIPIPEFMNSMNYEPLIASKRNLFDREALGYGISINKLYDHFEGIRKIIGVENYDLWAVSVLWLKYLEGISNEMEEEKK
ncbi:hypothetical protein SAMN02745163_02507 [Clostridium cavendishii DSM 21758]|uniref:DUF4065 domain-containing protein n=1 Tax=Clostridium cavendishii DSM 21758 TaxID=1121302 RepID=A0A1M6LV55_9CLOT|nr:hypothetical protein [Clostridium cavendishii]SHJ75056.1 hypothetical protein SAMN02745163_02507 [Clostridium cavendishii DSM 21758]